MIFFISRELVNEFLFLVLLYVLLFSLTSAEVVKNSKMFDLRFQPISHSFNTTWCLYSCGGQRSAWEQM